MITIPRPQAEIIPLCERAAWKALRQHHAKIQNVHLRQLFAEDLRRGEHFAFEAVDSLFCSQVFSLWERCGEPSLFLLSIKHRQRLCRVRTLLGIPWIRRKADQGGTWRIRRAGAFS